VGLVPVWYELMLDIAGHRRLAFRLYATGQVLTVDGGYLILITAGLNAVTIIVGFAVFAAIRRTLAFDRRLVFAGYRQATLIAAKTLAIAVVAAGVAAYTALVLLAFWRPGLAGWAAILAGFTVIALAYGSLGLLLGVVVKSDLEGFFLIIMGGLMDTFLQNPLGNPSIQDRAAAAFCVAGVGGRERSLLEFLLLPYSGIAPFPPAGDDRCMELRFERVVSTPAEDAWAVVGEHFGQIGEWASAITESVMDGQPGVGQIRTCHIAGIGPIALGVIRERLVDFDPEARSLSYEAAEGIPGFIVRAVSRWSVHQGPGTACTVRIHATLTLRPAARLLGPVLRWRMRADTRRVLAEFRYRVETGHPHPVKLSALTSEDAQS
jgi:hypothetical protein